ncbi:stage V sporulation protein T [Dorea ammoniilytica]|uniref:Stage V sporulation protein T n=2 Tax=Dorea ammoniilytica TaxID=2981788 RepID=A0ABT2S6N2_9FIRM|nr:stage V sporulation protein T [Dorea ammoniilytica]MCU6700250.1 stage V sporulation protein T [Dorea ammoniilytica]
MEKYVENRRINYMKATGIVRRIDDLGRVVIPKEIRRTLRIREGDPLEIFTDREGEVILKKYSPIGELANFAGQYAESIAQALGCLVCICDTDQVITASGNGRKELQDKYISSALRKVMDGRKTVLASEGSQDYVRIVAEQEAVYAEEVIAPIICVGDSIGAVVLLNQDSKKEFGEPEKKAALCAAGFLGRQME